MNEFLDRLEKLIDMLCQLVIKEAPIATAVAPFTGPYAGAVAGGATAAGIIAGGVHTAIQLHEASGGTQEGAMAGGAAIIQAVTAASVLDPATMAKLNAITAALAPATVGTIPIHG